ncbi:MAG: flippase activity-associated protein Agl23 [Chthonomonadales bacterium]
MRRTTSLSFAALILLVTAGALALRLPSLDARPVHADESVHMVKFHELWKHGTYRYDPNEFHGPTLYYSTLPVVWAMGRAHFADTTEGDYRLVTVLFGAGMILLLPLFADGLGRRSVVWAGILIATSPAMVFYSRYYIQEALLAFFTVACIACAWRYVRSGRWPWAAGASASAGLMAATKETAVLSFLAGGAALLLLNVRARGKVGRPDAEPSVFYHLSWRGWIAVAAGAVAVAELFLTGFFTNPRGITDSIRAYIPWVTRAGETGLHRHPFLYYLSILGYSHYPRAPIFSEAVIILLALAGGIAAFRMKEPGRRLALFLALYTLFVTLIYSAIPYKTPWCVLDILVGMALLGGLGADAFLRCIPGIAGKGVSWVLLGAGIVWLARQAYLASVVYSTAAGNPYAYAQTVPDAVRLGRRIVELAAAGPNGARTPVYVVSTDAYYWPLPWYLRALKSVGYWTQLPAGPMPPIVVASADLDEALAPRLNDAYLMTGYYGLRPGALYEVWVRMDLWKEYLEMRKRLGRPPGDD